MSLCLSGQYAKLGCKASSGWADTKAWPTHLPTNIGQRHNFCLGSKVSGQALVAAVDGDVGVGRHVLLVRMQPRQVLLVMRHH